MPTNKENTGCPYRKWGWHDGGPDYTCTLDGKCCIDSWSDWVDYEDCENFKKVVNVKKWLWMMDYCKKNGLAPANEIN